MQDTQQKRRPMRPTAPSKRMEEVRTPAPTTTRQSLDEKLQLLITQTRSREATTSRRKTPTTARPRPTSSCPPPSTPPPRRSTIGFTEALFWNLCLSSRTCNTSNGCPKARECAQEAACTSRSTRTTP